MEFKEELGLSLKRFRKAFKLNQREIATFVGVTESAVSRWESGEIGNMRRDRIAKLAEVLKISPLVIMGAEEFIDKPLNLSSEQATLLRGFDSLNTAGRNALMAVLDGLRAAYPARVAV